MMGFGGWMGFGGAGMLLGSLIWIALIVLVIWGAVRLFGQPTTNTQADALDILRRRYAAGEITSAEYETAKRSLA